MTKNAIISLLTAKVLWESSLIVDKTNHEIVAFTFVALMIFVLVEVLDEAIMEEMKNAKDKNSIADSVRKHSNSDNIAS